LKILLANKQLDWLNYTPETLN